ncbi:hypothetical protein NEOLEDRAFT_1076404 [Neolentinus lepideus HHB14362 ss-1]|uniref:Uncharacterized protein n=1 Tax=Neolentinus lepideus HHB14362 ss-1 TaxID=1314782 RepID=A0A165NTN6_9AGAM|nr:hypothetical protein NEOLEDRAFT_1076404 [Neolentinus lepideus HHB14362 ss-1]
MDECHAQAFAEGDQPTDSKAWFPYPTKTMFLLDVLDNLPRLRISDALMRMFLWVLREAGAASVPSFKALRKFQDNQRKESGINTVKCESVQGNIFYMNDVPALIAKDYANPLTRPLMTFYPHNPSTGVSEVWHGGKLNNETPLDQLCPHYIDEAGDFFYVNEIAELRNGSFAIPKRWKMQDANTLYADSYTLHQVDCKACYIVDDSAYTLIKANDFKCNYLDLLEQRRVPACHQSSQHHLSIMPNPLREVAEGEPLYSSWITVWGDDVSANRTKAWNKHWNVYVTHDNLPRRLLQQEFHVHFASTSPNASVVEQFGALKKMIESTHKEPLRVPNPFSDNFCRFRLFVIDADADNPMQSEECGHIGGNGNHDCRRCKRGGPEALKVTAEGYHNLFEPQEARTARDTLAEVQAQVRMACSGVAQPVKDRQSFTGVKDLYTQPWIDQLIARARQLKAENPGRPEVEISDELMVWVIDHGNEIYNPFLQVEGFDINRDTPVEVLHTILLGVVKYSWHMMHSSALQEKDYNTFFLRLQSSSVDGLSIPPIRASYLQQYRNSLIGKQFKQIMQTTVFHIQDLVDEAHFKLWKAVGLLGALLWYPEIADLEEYLKDLRVAIANVLDTFASIDPAKMWKKIKLHLLEHIPDDIRRFGPIIGRSTEIFECFNAIFRYCAILTNRISPSHDIAIQLADQEALKQRITGGMWMTSDGRWVRASEKVRRFLETHKILQNHLGWTVTKANETGMSPSFNTRPVAMKKRSDLKYNDTQASRSLNSAAYSRESVWIHGETVIAASEDVCRLGSWVFAKSPFDGSTMTGRILEILIERNSCSTVVVLEQFEVGAERHPTYDMPTLLQRHKEQTTVTVNAKDIHFIFNTQHDCLHAGCAASGTRPHLQERQETQIQQRFIEHTAVERYIINMHALHNAHLIRSVLPRELTQPRSYVEDRRQAHDVLAAKLKTDYDARQKKLEENREKRKKENTSKKGKEKQQVRATGEEQVRPQLLPADDSVETLDTVQPSKKRRREESSGD